MSTVPSLSEAVSATRAVLKAGPPAPAAAPAAPTTTTAASPDAGSTPASSAAEGTPDTGLPPVSEPDTTTASPTPTDESQAAGTTPADVGDAGVAPDPDLEFAKKLAGGDEKLIPKKVIEYNNRIAEQERELKELRKLKEQLAAQPAPAPPAPAAPVVPQTMAAPAAPEVAVTPQEVEAKVVEFVRGDGDCSRFAQAVRDNEAQVKAWDAKAAEIKGKIQLERTFLAHPSAGELEKEERKLVLSQLYYDLQEAEGEKTAYNKEADRFHEAYRARQQQIRGHFEGHAREAVATRQRNEEIEAESQQFGKAFTSAFDTEVATRKLSEDVADVIREMVTKAAMSEMMPGNLVKVEDAPREVKRLIDEAFEGMDRYHRSKSAMYAAQKAADVAPQAAPAPTPPAPMPAKPRILSDINADNRRRLREAIKASQGAAR